MSHPKFGRYMPGKWCRIVAIVPGRSVQTACYGRWPADHLYEASDVVDISDRCMTCERNVEYDVIEINVAELDDSPPRYARTRTRDSLAMTVVAASPLELFDAEEPTRPYPRFDVSDLRGVSDDEADDWAAAVIEWGGR